MACDEICTASVICVCVCINKSFFFCRGILIVFFCNHAQILKCFSISRIVCQEGTVVFESVFVYVAQLVVDVEDGENLVHYRIPQQKVEENEDEKEVKIGETPAMTEIFLASPKQMIHVDQHKQPAEKHVHHLRHDEYGLCKNIVQRVDTDRQIQKYKHAQIPHNLPPLHQNKPRNYD